MSSCVVKGCKSKSTKGSSLRFYSFPGNPTRRQLWLSNIQLKRKLKAGATVCGLHFRPQDYDEGYRLRHDAVPGEARDFVQDCETDNVRLPVEEVCRICLTSDRKVFTLRDRKLKQAYSDVTGITIISSDRLPLALCWECKARIFSAAACQYRARTAQHVLEGLLNTYGSITAEAVKSVNTRAKKLTSGLTHKYINSNDDYVFINEDPLTEASDIKLLHNVDIKNEVPDDFEVFIDENHDDDDDDDDRKDDIEENETDFVENDEVGKESRKNKEKEIDNKNSGVDDVNDVEINDVDDVESTKVDTEIDAGLKKQGRRKRVQKPKESTKDKDKPKSEPRYKMEYLKDYTVTKINHTDEIAAVERRKESASYKNAPYKCEVCYRGYIYEGKYQAHILKHTDKYGTFECLICKTRYKTSRILRHHTTDVHSEKYKCNKCPFVARTKTAARNHVKFHAGTKYQCPHCPRQFDISSTYYCHLRVKHACDEVCEYCGHTFLNKYGATRHKNIVHKFDKDTVPLEGPYCAACDVKFASQVAHDKHLTMSSKHRTDNESPDPIQNEYRPPPADPQTHEKKKTRQPIDCEECGLTLRNRNVYAWHFRKEHRGLTRTQHPVMKPPIYMCEQCGRKFASMAVLRDHKRVHSGARNFKCEVCSKTFVRKINLQIHEKIHSATRQTYGCDVCGKHFSSPANRWKHMFIHSGVKPHRCGACGRGFAGAAELRAHFSHVHDKRPWPKRTRHKKEP